MNMPGSLFLTGPMGAGKSTIGRQLSKQLKMPFYDSDHEIEQRTGVDIPLIFELEGEAGFRKREAAVIDDLSQQESIVLATGGGAIIDPQNRNRLGARGFVIYLNTSVDQQLSRTRKGRDRPLLQNDDPRAVLEALMATREPLYREIADMTVDTDCRKVRDVVKEILDRLESPNSARV